MTDEAIVRAPNKVFSNVLPWLVCGLGALFYCYEYLLRISPSVMTNDLMATFGLDAGELGMWVAYYYYIYAPMQLPVGLLMDRFGPRKLLVMACLICSIGSLGFAFTHHAYMIGISRLFIGFGSAFAFVGVLKLASIWLPENRFAMVSGMATGLGMVGAMVGDIAMASVVNHHGWRNTVLYSGYVGIALSLLILFLMRDDSAPAKKVSSPSSPVSFKKLWPEILQLIKNPFIWLNGLSGCLLYLPTSAFAELWGIPYLQSAYGFNHQAAAAAISMIFLGWAVGGPLAGFISDRLKRRCLPIICGAVVAGVLAIVLLYVPGLSKTVVYGLMFLFGIFSSVQVIVFAIGRELSPDDIAGTAIAFTNMLVMVGGVIFQPVIGVLLDMGWDGSKVNSVPVYAVSDYKFALMVVPIGVVLSIFLMLLVRDPLRKT